MGNTIHVSLYENTKFRTFTQKCTHEMYESPYQFVFQASTLFQYSMCYKFLLTNCAVVCVCFLFSLLFFSSFLCFFFVFLFGIVSHLLLFSSNGRMFIFIFRWKRKFSNSNNNNNNSLATLYWYVVPVRKMVKLFYKMVMNCSVYWIAERLA